MTLTTKNQKEKERKEKQKLARDIKRANQRLATQFKKGIRTPSYKFIEREEKRGISIYSKAKSGAVKFRTDIASLTKRQITDLQKSLEKYLRSPTSTKIGTQRTYNRLDSFNKTMSEKGFSSLSMDEYINLWEFASLKNLEEAYTSSDLTDFYSKKPDDMTDEELAEFLLPAGTSTDKIKVLEIKDTYQEKIVGKTRKEWKHLIT